jgi:hypothetical protein
MRTAALPPTPSAAVPFLDERAQRVPHDPHPRRGGAGRPAAADLDGEVGMILADVVQVVGDGALDVARGIVLKQLEQRDHRARIFLERAQPRRPG